MARVAVVESTSDRIQPCKEQTSQRRRRRHPAKVAVHAARDCLGRRARGNMCLNQPNQVRDPHSGSQTLAADVSQAKDHAIVNLVCRHEVARHMPNGECLTRNLKVSITRQSRGTQTPVHLCGFDKCCMQFGVILLELSDLQLQFQLTRLSSRCSTRRRGYLDIDGATC